MCKKWRLQWKNRRLLFLLPGLAGVTLFYLLPFLEVVRRSFLKSGSQAFVGWANYRMVAQNGAFHLALKNTMLYITLGVPLLMGISLALALLFRNLAARRRLVSALLVPMAAPAAVMVLTIQILFHGRGLINGGLSSLSQGLLGFPDFSGIDYLNSKWAIAVVLCSFLWKNTGYMMILWLAGLSSLPKDVEEAAKVDGANRWQNWHYIIRPGLSGSFFTIGMLSVLQIFKSYREVWMVAGSYPQENIYFLQHLLQNWYLKLEFDQMAVLTVLMAVVLLAVCFLLQKKWD
ncbi:MAG: sugar ABC transporter permease [Roseburia sp.]|nr:sugar ABC transporter permease [Roseburia sp.]